MACVLARLRRSSSRPAESRFEELNSGIQALRFIERRKLYVERGFSSLFRFCVEGLGLTEDQA
ncbi:MAG: hypothetical protein RIU46_26215, partial [Deltaproteobacteria bacterium]